MTVRKSARNRHIHDLETQYGVSVARNKWAAWRVAAACCGSDRGKMDCSTYWLVLIAALVSKIEGLKLCRRDDSFSDHPNLPGTHPDIF